MTCESHSTTVPGNHSLKMIYNWIIYGSVNPTESRYIYSTTKHTLTVSDIRKTDASMSFICQSRENVSDGIISNRSESVKIAVMCMYPSNLL